MTAREIKPAVYWVGAIDFERRLFDALVPTPDGTSYNAYLVKGSSATALIDTVDPEKEEDLLANLKQAEVESLDYLVANHAEQDHSGALPTLLERFPRAKIVCNEKCRDQLIHLWGLPPARFQIVKDRETLSLGDKTLEFVFAPWVHWPETMFTYLREDQMLFSCDLFGSHLASASLYVDEPGAMHEPTKRYYSEIMMPYRSHIRNHLDKLQSLSIDQIAPSHGPLHRNPAWVIEAHRNWTSDTVKNEVVLPYVSMHGSTETMAHAFVKMLIRRGIVAHPFDLTRTDMGKLAIALVDAATVVFATPTVVMGPHPLAVYAAYFTNVLKPKTKFISVIGSFGWGGKTVDYLTKMLDQLSAELIPAVFIKGAPKGENFASLEKLADEIAARHKGLGMGPSP
jgi:flavorubredoxin